MWEPVITLCLELADLFSNLKRRLSIAPTDHFAGEYLPTPDSIRARANLSQSNPRFLDTSRVVFEYVLEVQLRWNKLRSDTDLVARFSDANIAAADSAVGGYKPLEGLPESDFRDKGFRIHLGHTVQVGGQIITMRKLVEGTVDQSTHPELDIVTRTADSAINTLLPLRRFDDTVIRLLALKQVSQLTNVPRPEILALLRAEGSLGVFPSGSSLKDPAPGALPPVGTPVGNVPSASVADMAPTRAAWRQDPHGGLDNANEGEMTIIKMPYRPDISHLVWLADPAKPNFPHPAEDAHIKEFALATALAVQPIGGDALASLYLRDSAPIFADSYAAESAKKWHDAGFSVAGDPVAAARQRWNDMLDTLDVWRTRGHSGNLPEAVVVAPKDPVVLLAGILAEGVALLRKLRPQSTLFGPSFTDRVPLAIAAMRYNGFVPVPDDTVLAAFVSAMHNAVAGKSGFDALRVALRADPEMWSSDPNAVTFLGEASHIIQNTRLSTDVEKDLTSLARAKSPLDPELVDRRFAKWLLRNNNKELLFGFVMNAGMSQWASFQGMRNHFSRLNRMELFYDKLLSS